jgi:hypothetical protein
VKQDVLLRLLREVKRGEVTIEDARSALEGSELTEEQYESVINHGVFNEVPIGTVVRASIKPSGESALVIIASLWGVFWTLYWAFTLSYGLMNGWNQQQLSFHLGMIMLTLIIMGIIYLRFVMPDVVVIKHRRNKYIPAKDPESWHEYDI